MHKSIYKVPTKSGLAWKTDLKVCILWGASLSDIVIRHILLSLLCYYFLLCKIVYWMLTLKSNKILRKACLSIYYFFIFPAHLKAFSTLRHAILVYALCWSSLCSIWSSLCYIWMCFFLHLLHVILVSNGIIIFSFKMQA